MGNLQGITSEKPLRRGNIQAKIIDLFIGSLLQKSIRSTLIKFILKRRAIIEKRKTGVVYNALKKSTYQNPYKNWNELRNKDPIHWSDISQAWVLSRHSDVDAVLRDHKRFSNGNPREQRADKKNEEKTLTEIIFGDPGYHRFSNSKADESGLAEAEPDAPSMLASDPPDHTRLRILVAHAFTPKAITLWESKVQSVAKTLIEDIGDESEFDFLERYAIPFPLTVIAEMIGVPVKDRVQFKSWTAKLARTLEPGLTSKEIKDATQAGIELAKYFNVIIEQRRTAPENDLISLLVKAEDEGDKLSNAEVHASLRLLLVAGHETTANLLGNGMYALLKNPDQLNWLRNNLDQMNLAVEEMLRYDTPVASNGRVALTDVEIGGKLIKKGDFIVLLHGAANHDTDMWKTPDSLRLDNLDGRDHLSLGRGIHYCLGAPLARLEGEIGFEKVLKQWNTIELTEPPRYNTNAVFRGLTSLKIRVSS